jgi:prepilin-type processing-associated H-X9-DG protein
MTNLKQWGLVFKLYTDDHDGSFISGEGDGSGKPWFELLRPYDEDYSLCLCPTATKLHTEGGRNSFAAWKVGEVSGSYGLNGWVYSPRKGNVELRGRGPLENHWGTPLSVQGGGNVPMLAGALWFEGWPRHTDTPPDLPGNTDANMSIVYDPSQMHRFCVNRHEGHVNVLFVDFSVRKIGLKELWTLKWHRNYDTSGPWTSAGGVSPTHWPPWMRNFKDY